ncbi:MAG: GtrA family protein [Clostridia bacterium]|nr:GtrA family protein [Clostridia bacterium]
MKKSNALQAVKFALFSASAGIIQVGSFTLLNELVLPNINIQNEKLMAILSAEYGVCYLIALVLSVLWNFTLNRRYTFRSAANIPVAMAKIAGFYLVFTPVSTILGNLAADKGVNEYIVLALTMASNFVLEYLFCKFVVYRNQENTLPEKTKKAE